VGLFGTAIAFVASSLVASTEPSQNAGLRLVHDELGQIKQMIADGSNLRSRPPANRFDDGDAV